MTDREVEIHRAHMKVAHIYADLSRARRLKAGCVLVRNNRILSIGMNGMPSGKSNDCEVEKPDGTLTSKPEVLHAEANALLKVATSTETTAGATAYITHAPCFECSKLLYQARIREVYWGTEYRTMAGLDFLREMGVLVQQLGDAR